MSGRNELSIFNHNSKMKKIVSFALLMCSLFLANVQGQVGFIYNGTTYQDGDSMCVYINADAHAVTGVAMKNLGSGVLQNLVVTVTPVEESGIEAWGVCCGGACVPALTSTAFTMTPGQQDDAFSIDISLDNSVANAYGVYSINVSNGMVNCTVKMRVQVGTAGIAEAKEQVAMVAFPNPAQGAVSISYELNQPATLAIVDMQGRTVKEVKVNGNGTAVVDNLPAGIYAYGILGSNSMKKLVVK